LFANSSKPIAHSPLFSLFTVVVGVVGGADIFLSRGEDERERRGGEFSYFIRVQTPKVGNINVDERQQKLLYNNIYKKSQF
jgi:hypothetical protein